MQLGTATARPPVFASNSAGGPSSCRPGSDQGASAGEVDPKEAAKIAELKRRDAEVRAHELAHKSAGGRHAGGIHYDLQVGPDGRRYAVGGEVPIDVSAVKGDPAATLRKMEQVVSAALAPANPSAADRQIAAHAQATAQAARADLATQRYQEVAEGSGRAEPLRAALDLSA